MKPSSLVPVGVDPRSMIAGYAAIASLLLFGGPRVLIAVWFALDAAQTVSARLTTVLIGFVVGPLPIAGLGWWALRAHRADATLRGRGRAVFALVVAGVLTLPLVASLVMLVVRSLP